ATALLTLALGVGVNTTLFSFTNALLLRPWRAPDAHTLVVAHHRAERSMLIGVSAPELEFLRQNAATVDVAGTRPVDGTLWSDATTRSARGRLVSANYFSVLQVPVILGR